MVRRPKAVSNHEGFLLRQTPLKAFLERNSLAFTLRQILQPYKIVRDKRFLLRSRPTLYLPHRRNSVLDPLEVLGEAQGRLSPR
jgi:hypothetical protein